MEVTESTEIPNGGVNNRNNLVSTATISSTEVLLHPLVIFSISDHWTRRRAQEGTEKQVIGAVIGKQCGRRMEIVRSFELDFNVIDDEFIINRDFFLAKESHFKQVFNQLEFLGWYTTGEELSETHMKIHKQFCETNESPILLMLNPNLKNAGVIYKILNDFQMFITLFKELPILMYESIIDIVNGEAKMLFVSLTYVLTTEEAERIGIDYIARMSSNSSSESWVAEQLSAQYSTIKKLNSRIELILNYLKAVQSKELEENHEILREIYSLTHRLPAMQSSRFKHEFSNQNNEVHLLTLLGIMTKECHDLNQLVNKVNLLFDENKGMSRRLRTVFLY